MTVSLAPGTRLGSYEISAQIGAGGMGEVYRARDTKLNRDVALKILPPRFASDPNRLARFKREAQVLASLNHPNIAAIHELEEAEGVQALVLELVEGPTLAERIANGPIHLDDALAIAGQMADALDAAHDQGVIHRDLKPANIKVRRDGTVKLLDFGLAKLVQGSDTATRSPDVSQSPTITSLDATMAGDVVGTVAYMSPEQARGQAVDKRADIWAFACVLYEMLAGRSAFRAESALSTFANVLEREPDWQALPASTSRSIRDFLRRCLNKDPSSRLDDKLRVQIERCRTEQMRRGRSHVVRALVASVVLLGLVAAWWNARQFLQERPHEPVSILIADLENHTGDTAFDRTLEPVLRIAMEGAEFITAYDRSAISRTLGIRPPSALDERSTQEIAVKQGVDIVLSGGIDRVEAGYALSLKATQAVTGTVIARASDTTSGKDGVVPIATQLAMTIRDALGDNISDVTKRFAMLTLSATSLEAVHEWAIGNQDIVDGRFEEARGRFANAIARDQTFGLAFASMGMMLRNLGRQQEAEKYVKQALGLIDQMTEREQYRTRGLYYAVTADYAACVKEYGVMVTRYPGDAAAHNNFALCSTYLRDLTTAIKEMQRAVEILPKRALYRVNLGLYAAYAGDFQTAEREGRVAAELGTDLGLLAVAFAQLGEGRLGDARRTYEALARGDALNRSFASSGLGDLAVHEGRFSEAVRLLAGGAEADLMSKSPDRAAAKLTALAHAYVLHRQPNAALAAVDKALANSNTIKIQFLAARVFAQAGALDRARALASALGRQLQKEPRAYAKIVDGEAALSAGDARQAIAHVAAANALADTWIGHFTLGRAYLNAGDYAEADAEFDWCLKHRAEALSWFMDEEPTYGYYPAVHYYQGRAREALKSPARHESYGAYLAIREKAGEDPLLGDVHSRATP